jgi:hypothetical protein
MTTQRFDTSKLDKRTFDLGMIYAFTECVASGVKKIGLSPPQTEKELKSIINEVKLITGEYNVTYYVDNDFLETLLFNPEYTRGKTVIHLAENSKAVQDYKALKEEKNEHIQNGTLTKKVEEIIAWKLGKLLSYSDEAINNLISNPRFTT